MSEQEDTLRSPEQEQQIDEQGGDELAPGSGQENARKHPEKQRENRAKMGVKEDHKTEKMEEKRRGTFP
jgi:hypothetical protein